MDIDPEEFRKNLERKVVGASKQDAFTVLVKAMALVNDTICEVLNRQPGDTLAQGVEEATELADALRLMTCVNVVAYTLAARELEQCERLRDNMARVLMGQN